MRRPKTADSMQLDETTWRVRAGDQRWRVELVDEYDDCPWPGPRIFIEDESEETISIPVDAIPYLQDAIAQAMEMASAMGYFKGPLPERPATCEGLKVWRLTDEGEDYEFGDGDTDVAVLTVEGEEVFAANVVRVSQVCLTGNTEDVCDHSGIIELLLHDNNGSICIPRGALSEVISVLQDLDDALEPDLPQMRAALEQRRQENAD